ncbi:AGE family epimerase/isomerase [Dysgonomonas sp. Marseille-P4677]|uniref:AGE family epimerase/isomerase n=1 Tax=Dysgonomonas sp. Marseille-P4677 TaxID=2364790 RepID=UPI001914258D|nr:AGE family epimerase/isomerase [Dysgonomonas sp. Marseille-P4677]MBK5722193.1 AGE family epimerase/isomerase [Dysgonomonas sp. Marseille-P4677]
MNGFKKELTDNILTFWMDKMQDNMHGGFYGRIDSNNKLHPKADKGAILNARILWTFSAAYRILGSEEYLKIAQCAFDYITKYFIDRVHGGAYWAVDYLGNPVNTKKQTYVQGFMLYGFSEFYRATKNEQALELAIDFFHLIEKCYDEKLGGYFEAFTKEWLPLDDMRLSEKDENEKKTMNTHLHVLEPYTNLYRIWKNEKLEQALKRLINIFEKRILDSKTHHLNLFFDEEWNIKSTAISYGHDIEASWLLFEAVEVLDDLKVREDIKLLSIKIADAAAEGISAERGMIYEKNGKKIDKERHWWVQAEAVVGFMYAYKNSGNIKYKQYAEQIWTYIKEQMIDEKAGEWYWSRLADGSINQQDDKAGFWKCPYHNGRMCMEMIENFNLV